jgi:hypothetical protein
MSVGVTTVLVGGVIGLALALFGTRMLVTGRAPAATARSFRHVRDAAMYHLLFGVGLVVLAAGTSAPGGGVTATASAVIAVVLVGVAIARHRPRGRKQADPERPE